MADMIDQAILLGIGLEKRVKKVLNELSEEGKSEEGKSTEEGDEKTALPPRKDLENRLVEEGIKAIKELISSAKSGKERVDNDVQEAMGKLLERTGVATKDDIEIIEKMAQVAREKVDALEKKIEELEKKIG